MKTAMLTTPKKETTPQPEKKETKKETKLETEMTPENKPKEREETVISFDKSSVDFYFIMHLLDGMLDNGYNCKIRATGIYNKIVVVIEHPKND